ncbi:MAG: transglycosylase SLT domain-containing protein [Patescibacteria group bacterium]|nr:MAG: transglycosylase SLT domain-containing protein [Patescibacteria group bacterium]
MPTPKHLLAAAVVSLSFFGAVGTARAEGPLMLEMADGLFYNPASGLLAESRGALLKLIEAQAPHVVAVETPAAPAVPEPAAPESVDGLAPTLQNAVLRARAALQERIDTAEKTKPDVVTSYDVWVDVTLAVWNAQTNEIQYVEAKKNGTKIQFADAPDAYAISVKRTNGVNSTFVVDTPERVVVAVRYPIFKNISTSKTKPKYELHDVVYTPYSDGLHTAEMAAWGKNVLRLEILAAYDALRSTGVRSRAFPDRLVADVVDPHLVEAIAIIEHVGLGALSGPNAEEAMDAFYVTMGGNQDKAYIYARSSAGALGLVQFIPSTYAIMAKRKELNLISDFTKGMSDPVNAIKAQIAYLDAILASMPLAVKDMHYVDPARVDEYLAAAYNTGETRVKRAIKQWGDTWSEPHNEEIAALAKRYGARSAAVNTMKKATLLPETVTYVKKLRQALKVLSPPELPTT